MRANPGSPYRIGQQAMGATPAKQLMEWLAW
jgi:hypothetical protein